MYEDIFFYLMFPCIQESIALFEGFHSSSLPVRPSDRSIIKMDVSMKYW